MIEIEWDSQDPRNRSRRPYEYKNSTIHGWITKLRGTITGNERVRSRGIDEMRRAARERRRKQRRSEERRRPDGQSSWRMFSVFGGRQGTLKKPRRDDHHRSGSGNRAIIVNDIRYGSRDHRGPKPLMHFPHRTHPPYHGHGTMLTGVISRDRTRHATGIAMNHAAHDERDRERRRRMRQRRKEGHDMRVDARGSRRR